MMSIVGQNALLNQYVPTFYLKDLKDGDTIAFDARRRAFVNTTGSLGSASLRLSDLLDVSDSLDNPLALTHGKSLIYNAVRAQWEAAYTDYNDLTNKPTAADYSFADLADVAKPAVPGAFVKWNALGTELVYADKITGTDIEGLSAVAFTGDYTDLKNAPAQTSGTVTKVKFKNGNGVYGVVVDSTTTPELSITLEDITPTSVTATGDITGANLTGTNTGDQTITLVGDVTGSGTGTFNTQLADTGVAAGTYGGVGRYPVLTIDSKGRVTAVDTIELPDISGAIPPTVSVTAGVGIEVTADTTASTAEYTVSLLDTGVAAGTYGNRNLVPTIEVNSAGQITSVSTSHVDTSTLDLINETDTLVIAPRHQYIVTGSLEVSGRIENNGRIAVL